MSKTVPGTVGWVSLLRSSQKGLDIPLKHAILDAWEKEIEEAVSFFLKYLYIYILYTYNISFVHSFR